MNNVIYVFARNLDWTKGGKMKWATVWTWMNPNCNWDDISWFKPTYIFSTVRWLCGLVVVQLSWLSGRALTAQILSWVFAHYFFTWKYRDTSFIIYVMYLHVTFSHENTVTQVSSFTLWKFHLKNLTLHMNMHSIFMARFLVVYKYFVMSIVVPSLVSSLAHSSLAVSDEC